MTTIASGAGELDTPAPNPQDNLPAGGDPNVESAKSWIDSLPEDLRGNESLKKFKGIDNLAKSYVELEKHVGGTIKIPQDTAKPEEWDAFYNKIGRPEKPEGYGFVKPENLPAGVEWSDEMAGAFSALAHKNGLTKHQANELIGFWTGLVTKQAEGFWTSEKGMAALETSFNKNEDQINKVVSSAQRTIKELADDDLVKVLDETGLGNHPAVLKFLAKVGDLFDEDTLPENFGPGSTGMSVNEAKAEIAAIRNDRKHPWHKGDQESVNHMNRLYEAAFGRKVVTTVG